MVEGASSAHSRVSLEPSLRSSFEVERRATMETSDCRSENIGLLIEVRTCLDTKAYVHVQSRSNRP